MLTFLPVLCLPLLRAQAMEPVEIISRAATASDVKREVSSPVREVVSGDTLVRTSSSEISHYVDTVTYITERLDSTLVNRLDTLPVDSQDRRGHYIEAHVGLGYGTMGYDLEKVGDVDGHVNGSFSSLLQLQYAYFFHKNVGIGIGLWLSNYTSHAHLEGNKEWENRVDSDTEQQYTHHTDIKEWRERETVHNLGIPVSLQFQAWKPGKKAGFFSSLGVAPSFQVGKRYKLLDGTLDHKAYYDNWHLTLEDMHEFGERDYTGEDGAKGKMDVKYSIGVFADMGVLFKIAPQVDFFLGGYFTYSINDVNNSDKRELGWGSDTEYAFMEKYESAYATTNAGKSRPWEVGLKLGVHWRAIRRPQTKKVDYYDYVVQRDTSMHYIERYDTITTSNVDTIKAVAVAGKQEVVEPEQPEQPARVEILKKVYFDFDSSVLNDDAKTYLNSVVEMLDEADVRISVQGHASREGLRSYNDALSKRRAQSVVNYLTAHGVSRSRIELLSFGPTVENDENVNHELTLDRRVEIKVITADKQNKYTNRLEIKSKK